MASTEKLTDIANRQRALLTELELEVKLFDELDPVKERKHLEAELEKCKAELAEAKKRLVTISGENIGLKSQLYEQIYNEKVLLLNQAARKLEIYFQSGLLGERNALAQLETVVQARINQMKASLKAGRIDAQDEIFQKLNEVSALLQEKLAAARLQQNTTLFSEDEQQELQRLKDARITDEQIQQLAKKNNIESLVGLNLLNKLGILLIIVGVITASRYTYLLLPDLLKGIIMFLLGGAMLVGGELLNRKRANVFSLGITAGGVAVLYIALSVSYFGLGIVSMYPALLLCILITATAFLLSTRYNSQTVLTFALLGGYLPIFSIGGSMLVLYAAIVYFVALNLLALSISFGRKWAVASFVGIFLNIGGTLCVCFNFYERNTPLDQLLSIVYVIFAFLVYTLIPILGTYQEKSRFQMRDVVLIAINTLFSCAMMYTLFYRFHLDDFDGLLTILFALLYLLLGRLIETKFTNEKNITGLFYLTGFAFVILTIPLQFGIEWLSMGWLIEGAVLSIYGILTEEKVFKQAGLLISTLCLFSFLLVDTLGYGSTLFGFKYLAITLSSAAILSALIYKKDLTRQPQLFFKHAVIVNLWLYLRFLINHTLLQYLWESLSSTDISVHYLSVSLSIVMTFLFAYIVPRVKLLGDRVVQNICMTLYIAGILRLLLLHSSRSFFVDGILQTPRTTIIGTLVLMGISLLSILALNDVVKFFVLKETISIAFYPLILSGYFVVLLTQLLICQYQLYFSSAAISIIYVITALAWIVLGFMRRYSFLRQFGLGLAILAVIKLFLVDLYSLTQGYKIVSYFVLGVVLLAISFVYQYFNKRLESNAEAVNDAQKNH